MIITNKIIVLNKQTTYISETKKYTVEAFGMEFNVWKSYLESEDGDYDNDYGFDNDTSQNLADSLTEEQADELDDFIINLK